MEGGDDDAVAFDVDAVLEGVRGANLARSEDGGRLGLVAAAGGQRGRHGVAALGGGGMG